jgi:3-hydroxyacyl-CoA dehydrogenase
VAVITVDNPPLNGLNHELRAGLVAGIDQASGDAGVEAVIIIGAGKAFSSGADIREFSTPKSTAEPTWSWRWDAISALHPPGRRSRCPK